jgi:hypothetical protein
MQNSSMMPNGLIEVDIFGVCETMSSCTHCDFAELYRLVAALMNNKNMKISRLKRSASSADEQVGNERTEHFVTRERA